MTNLVSASPQNAARGVSRPNISILTVCTRVIFVHDKHNPPPAAGHERKAIAFHRERLATGGLVKVARLTKVAFDQGGDSILVFDAETSHPIEIDFRGTVEKVVGRVRRATGHSPPDETGIPATRGPGRPRLGVIAREVTLLPRHWEWLNRQPGGASVTLRTLVEEARRGADDTTRIRGARENVYRFMLALGGDLPGFEEASRGLFSGDLTKFVSQMAEWPEDIRAHAVALANQAFA